MITQKNYTDEFDYIVELCKKGWITDLGIDWFRSIITWKWTYWFKFKSIYHL